MCVCAGYVGGCILAGCPNQYSALAAGKWGTCLYSLVISKSIPAHFSPRHVSFGQRRNSHFLIFNRKKNADLFLWHFLSSHFFFGVYFCTYMIKILKLPPKETKKQDTQRKMLPKHNELALIHVMNCLVSNVYLVRIFLHGFRFFASVFLSFYHCGNLSNFQGMVIVFFHFWLYSTHEKSCTTIA